AGDARCAAGQRQGGAQALPRADLEHRRRRAGAGEHVPLSPSSTARENFRGSLLMTVAMAGFAVEDVLIKQLTVGVPVGQVLAMVGAGAGGLFAVMVLARGQAMLSRGLFCLPVMLRNLGEAGGSTAFVSALALATLSSASAILQA